MIAWLSIHILFILFIIYPSITKAEECLYKRGLEYIGWEKAGKNFMTCDGSLIEIEDGEVKKTHKKCKKNLFGPLSNIKGEVINVNYIQKLFYIKDSETGTIYSLFYPNTKDIKLGEHVIASIPVEGRAESITINHEVQFTIAKVLMESYELISKGKYAQAQKLLETILAKDPGNPLALNNLAAIMVAMKKFDKAESYLIKALPKAKGYLVNVNRVCTMGNICIAFSPVSGTTGNQDLEALIKMNLEMVKGYMEAGPIPGKGLR